MKNRIPKGRSLNYSDLCQLWDKYQPEMSRSLAKNPKTVPQGNPEIDKQQLKQKYTMNKREVAEKFEALLENLKRLLTDKKDSRQEPQ